ncbi:MAG TPA: glycoside hydrolase family 2 TIM barrel-domain containing protein, partial [Blastocatellia bacterium]|nr:glycoside hydrolase family 2 TIM barrel-domain containing protein [Blastocatellia bacterium]
YLSGTGKDDGVLWDFYCTAGRKSGSWSKIAVPSCWEQRGFGAYNYGGDGRTGAVPSEQGKYRTRFVVPRSWKGRVIRLVFDGSMTDTEAWINGHSAGPVHQGSFYRFKYDITKLVNPGKTNLLEVTVSKASSNDSVNRAERAGSDYWVFGGIFRPVYLEALPANFIDRAAIDARADGAFAVDVYFGAQEQVAGRVTGQLFDARGVAVGEPFAAGFAAGQDMVQLKTVLAGPRLWTAETPNLYTARLTLIEGKVARHTVTERFGFRTFDVRSGDGLYLNGQRILLKGANRHCFWPESGRTLSRQISYDDARLIKEMNMNAVRMSHYPPDVHFLEACDELGLYVLDELGGWQRSYDTPTGRRLIEEMIKRDVNHPCILFWENGNEGGWNRDNDGEFAKWDPQKRVVLHPWELFNGVNTAHYRKYPEVERICAGNDLYMPTEFNHALYDGGGGAGLWDHWELIRKSKIGVGGFIWALVDESIERTDQNNRLDSAGNRAPDGILGPYRQKEGSYYTVKEIWCPVQVGPERLPGNFRGVVNVENRFDFTNLSECRFEWSVKDLPLSGPGVRTLKGTIASGLATSPDVPPHRSGELLLKLPPNWRDGDVLYLTAKDPEGRELWTWSWGLKSAREFAFRNVTGRVPPVRWVDDLGSVVMDVGWQKLRFSKQTGMLQDVAIREKKIEFGDGPRFVAFRRNGRAYDDISGKTALTNLSWNEGALEATYSGALKKVRWVTSPAGIELQYEDDFNGVVDVIGIDFGYPENKMKGIEWFGRGPARVWQNRMEGTRLDVWESAYNNSTPGESWAYPEFKGYFRDWKWAAFSTTEGEIELFAGADDTFLGLYKPADGKDGLLDLPQLGIAVLDVIPAMRNKFHTTDEIGPQSRPREVSGIKRGTLHFRFYQNEGRALFK